MRDFDVRANQLSRVLMGRKYLGGTQARKCKATEELPVQRKKTDALMRHNMTQRIYYVISSVHMAKNNHKSVPAQIITSPHFIKSSAPVPVQAAQGGVH